MNYPQEALRELSEINPKQLADSLQQLFGSEMSRELIDQAVGQVIEGVRGGIQNLEKEAKPNTHLYSFVLDKSARYAEHLREQA